METLILITLQKVIKEINLTIFYTLSILVILSIFLLE